MVDYGGGRGGGCECGLENVVEGVIRGMTEGVVMQDDTGCVRCKTYLFVGLLGGQ